MTKPHLGLLALAIFAANLGLSIIFPLIPHLAQSGAHTVGWIFSSYALALVIAQVVGGVLADRFDPRRVLALALWLYVLTLLGFCVTRSVPALMANRALEGLAIGLIIPAVMKLVVEGADPDRRGRAIGFVMGLGGIGFIIGPLMGGFLAGWGLALPFLLAAAVAAVAATGVTVGLPTMARQRTAQPLARAVRSEVAQIGALVANGAFLALVLPLMAVKINFSTLQAGVPLYAEARLGAGLHDVGVLFVITAVAYGLMQPVAGRLADRFATGALVTAGLAGLALLLVALAWPGQYGHFLPVWAVFSLVQSAAVLFAMKHLGDAIGEGATGRSFGLAAAIGDAGMILAPSLLLPVYAWRPEGLFWGLAIVTVGLWGLFAMLSARPAAIAAGPTGGEAL